MKYVNHVSIFCFPSIHTYIIIHYQCLTPWSIILDWFYLKNLWRGTLYLFVGVFFLKCLVIYYTYKASFLRSSILLSAICMNILLSFNICFFFKLIMFFGPYIHHSPVRQMKNSVEKNMSVWTDPRGPKFVPAKIP
jgi:hypothetical protein